jgi:hypothetical protein
MAVTDKNQAVIDFLLQCPQIKNNKLFFNYINGKDNDKQIITVSNDRSIQRPYIDGSVLRRYTFTLIDFRSITDQAIVKSSGFPNENVEELFDVQAILNWINDQAESRNYPDFGESCIVDDMKTSSDTPRLNGVDSGVKPALAKYSISIFIDYIDNSKRSWR